MTDVVMIEAALFQLRAASGDVDPASAPQLGLCINVLAGAIAAGHEGVNSMSLTMAAFTPSCPAATSSSRQTT